MKTISVTQILRPSGKKATIPVSIPDELYDTASGLEIEVALVTPTLIQISAWKRGGPSDDKLTEYASKEKGKNEAQVALARLIQRFQK